MRENYINYSVRDFGKCRNQITIYIFGVCNCWQLKNVLIDPRRTSYCQNLNQHLLRNLY